MERIETHVPGFDKLVDGGIPKGHIVLVTGTPGTGKSTFCAQILYHNVLQGKKCLYIDLEQEPGRIASELAIYGWDIHKTPNFKLAAVDSDNPNFMDELTDEFKNNKYDFICLDSLDSIGSNPIQPMDLAYHVDGHDYDIDPTNLNRFRLKTIFKALSRTNATVFVTSERVENNPGLTRDTISEFLCDGIVLLQSQDLADETVRTLAIRKMRSVKIKGGIHNFEFTDQGIKMMEGSG